MHESTFVRGMLGFVEVLGIVALAAGVQRWSQPAFAGVPDAICKQAIGQQRLSETSQRSPACLSSGSVVRWNWRMSSM
jgi:hypothetical protein